MDKEHNKVPGFQEIYAAMLRGGVAQATKLLRLGTSVEALEAMYGPEIMREVLAKAGVSDG